MLNSKLSSTSEADLKVLEESYSKILILDIQAQVFGSIFDRTSSFGYMAESVLTNRQVVIPQADDNKSIIYV
jgi:hypothetical protein